MEAEHPVAMQPPPYRATCFTDQGHRPRASVSFFGDGMASSLPIQDHAASLAAIFEERPCLQPQTKSCLKQRSGIQTGDTTSPGQEEVMVPIPSRPVPHGWAPSSAICSQMQPTARQGNPKPRHLPLPQREVAPTSGIIPPAPTRPVPRYDPSTSSSSVEAANSAMQSGGIFACSSSTTQGRATLQHQGPVRTEVVPPPPARPVPQGLSSASSTRTPAHRRPGSKPQSPFSQALSAPAWKMSPLGNHQRPK